MIYRGNRALYLTRCLAHQDLQWTGRRRGTNIIQAGRFCGDSTPVVRRNLAWPDLCETTSLKKRIYEQEGFIVLIDGDTVGPSQWSPLLTALSAKGHVTDKYLFSAAPSAQWQERMASLGINSVEVLRRMGGKRDPNDMAIAMAATRLASGGNKWSFALAVQDADFLLLADQLRHWGHDVTLVVPQGYRLGLCQAFEMAKMQVVTYDFVPEDGNVGRALYKAVLNPDGKATFEANICVDLKVHDCGALRDTFQKLNYLLCSEDPLLPAIARFFYANQLCPRTVWPQPLAISEAINVIAHHDSQDWRSNPGNLAFVLPLGTQSQTTASIRREYGSSLCRSLCIGGGPFVISDSEDLALRVLRKMGYLDNDLNADVGEAVDVFCQTGSNKRSLEVLGSAIPSSFHVEAKLLLLRSSFLSHKSIGAWKVAPSDKSVRQRLAAQGRISTANVTKAEVLQAMQLITKQEDRPFRKTYNGFLMDMHVREHRAHPHLRR